MSLWVWQRDYIQGNAVKEYTIYKTSQATERTNKASSKTAPHRQIKPPINTQQGDN